ncbi:MAG: hypothetical protein JNL58_02075 [Planctomyces sp.]|nr:hypothetical protein [Planctomyces sp.]
MSIPGHVAELLKKVEHLLELGRIEDALHIATSQSSGNPAQSNARAVCLMRLGKADEAVRVLRSVVIDQTGVLMRQDIPTAYKSNFAVALALAGNLSGATSLLAELGEETDTQVEGLSKCIRIARSKRSFMQKLMGFFGTSDDTRIELDFTPGLLR